jgi:hypothetical protein
MSVGKGTCAKDMPFNFEQKCDKLHDWLCFSLLEDHPLCNINNFDTLNISFSHEIGSIFNVF